MQALAILGLGCLLPDAEDPDRFWANLRDGRASARPVGASPVQAARQALDDAGSIERTTCGAILGHYAWAITDATTARIRPLYDGPINRALDAIFPGLILPPGPAAPPPDPPLAEAFGLGGPSYTIDAACASFHFALKLAALHIEAGAAEHMLVVAANSTDQPFLEYGLTTVGAITPGGCSQPFDARSQGLMPGVGAVAMVVGRHREGRRAHGVIRGIGLSSDGRGQHLTAPNPKGQLLACQRAYGESGLDPQSVDYVECHATGTPVGDRAELDLLEAVFGSAPPLAGAVKSNIGHTMTASGGAGLLKTLLAMRAGEIPPTIGIEQPLTEIHPSRVQLVRQPSVRNVRRAGVNAFGFGGTNAHLIVDHAAAWAPPAPPGAPPQLGISGMAAQFGPFDSLAALAVAITERRPGFRAVPAQRWRGLGGAGADAACIDSFTLDPVQFRMPPNDIGHLNPQQLLMLKVGDAALRDAGLAPGGRVAVIIAMAMEHDVHLLGGRWAMAERLRQAGSASGTAVADAALASLTALAEDALCPAPEASDFLAYVGNLMASRISALWDFNGPAFTIAAGEAGVFRAIDVARLFLASGEADAVLVGAVDLACGFENLAATGSPPPGAGDGAGAIVLTRMGEASAPVYAQIDPSADPAADAVAVGNLAELTGQCGVASAMAGVVNAALAIARRARPGDGRPWLAATPRAVCQLQLSAAPGPAPALPGPRLPWLVPITGGDQAGLSGALEHIRRELAAGIDPGLLEADATAAAMASHPLAGCLLGYDAAELSEEAARLAQALPRTIAGAAQWRSPRGSCLSGAPLADGGVAFVYSGMHTAYPGLCRHLPFLLPGAIADLAGRFADPDEVLATRLLWPEGVLSPEQMLQADEALSRQTFALLRIGVVSSFLATRLLQHVGIRPDVCLGYSLGEISMLFAAGGWELNDGWIDRLDRLRPVLDRLSAGGVGRFLVSAPAAAVAAALEAGAPAEISLVNSPRECVLVGDVGWCAALLGRLDVDHVQLPGGLAMHGRAAQGERAEFVRCFAAPLGGRPAPRLLLGGKDDVAWTADGVGAAVADSLVRPVDFAATVERAWQGGARLFIEMGPGNACTRWIGDTLAGRPHAALAVTRRGVAETTSVAQAAAWLVAHRRPVDLARLLRRAPAAAAGGCRVVLGGPPIADEMVARARAAGIKPVAAEGDPRGALLADIAAFQSRGHLAFLRARTRLVNATSGPPAAKATAIYTQADILEIAEGRTSAVFGPDFLPVDGFVRRVRVPGQPFTAMTRVVHIEGRRGAFDSGRIVTEFDIPQDAWFAIDGHVASMLALDAQGVLFLLSWLGVDLESRGSRRFRWLDAGITMLGDLPRTGETLRFDIALTGSFRDGESLILTFDMTATANGRPVLRNQACRVGFFTDAGLAGSQGIRPHHRRDGSITHRVPAALPLPTRGLGADDFLALARGDLGVLSAAHARPGNPALRLPPAALHMVDRVVSLDANGIVGERRLDPEHWAIRAHFKDDPVFPGPCMLEGAMQLLKIHALATGLHAAASGARFDLLTGRPYRLTFREQVLPAGQIFTYRLSIVEQGQHPEPYAVADVEFEEAGRTIGLVEGLGLRLAAGPTAQRKAQAR